MPSSAVACDVYGSHRTTAGMHSRKVTGGRMLTILRETSQSTSALDSNSLRHPN